MDFLNAHKVVKQFKLKTVMFPVVKNKVWSQAEDHQEIDSVRVEYLQQFRV